MTKNKKSFCCDDMREAIEECKIVDYDCQVRDYGINYGKNRVKMLNFCPWCGFKLPESLCSKIFDVIQHEYGIRWEADLENFTNIPKEFRTDEWWKKRGL